MNVLSSFICFGHQVLHYSHLFLCHTIALVVTWAASQVMDIKPFAQVLELISSITQTIVTHYLFR